MMPEKNCNPLEINVSMRPIKSERIKKLEVELEDLENWLKLGLVPKKDIEKHKEEISALKVKLEEEKERLQFLKESGEMDEYVAPKRTAQRGGYTDMPTIPDIDMAETQANMTDNTSFDMETDVGDDDDRRGDGDGDEQETEAEDAEARSTKVTEDDESYFSDRNRWRRGGIVDPEADDW